MDLRAIQKSIIASLGDGLVVGNKAAEDVKNDTSFQLVQFNECGSMHSDMEHWKGTRFGEQVMSPALDQSYHLRGLLRVLHSEELLKAKESEYE